MRMIPSARVLRLAFIGATVTWALLLPLATLAASRPHPSSAAYLFALAVYGAGRLACHQLLERSFQLWAHQMPVCARCTGIYLGAAIAAVWVSVQRWRSPDRVAILAACVPTVLTLVYEWTSGQTPANGIRAAAGVPIGVVVAALVVAATENQVN